MPDTNQLTSAIQIQLPVLQRTENNYIYIFFFFKNRVHILQLIFLSTYLFLSHTKNPILMKKKLRIYEKNTTHTIRPF